MECLEAVRIVFRKESSPDSQEEGFGREEKSCSDSVVKESQSAFLKLKYVLMRLGCLLSLSGKETRMGRWSEFKVVRGYQLRTVDRWAEQMEMSGEDLGP